MNQKLIIGSLALDLRRVAIGLHRGSFSMAKRFSEEALLRRSEVDEDLLRPYIKPFFQKMPEMLSQKDTKNVAEDALLLSILFQNYSQHFD